MGQNNKNTGTEAKGDHQTRNFLVFWNFENNVRQPACAYHCCSLNAKVELAGTGRGGVGASVSKIETEKLGQREDHGNCDMGPSF